MSLEGRCVLVTRPGDVGRSLVREIEKRGGQAWHAPAIRIVLLPDSVEAEEAREELARADRLLLTSANGLLGLLGPRTAEDLPVPPPPVWTVGGSTAGLAAERRFKPAVTVSTGGLEALVETLLVAESLDGKVVLWPRGNLARDEPANPLRVAGAIIICREVYETEDGYADEGPPRDAVDQADSVVFASPSAVRNLTNRTGVKPWQVVAIGETTGRAAQEAGWQRVRIAEESSRAAILAALEQE